MTRLGQHFLAAPAVLEKIAAALAPTPEDVVLEVGAGTGALTRVLAARVGRVVAIETDRSLARVLEGPGGAGTLGNVTVITGDALECDWHAAVGAGVGDFKVAGNIPYAITSPLIEKALEPPRPERIVFLVQREVADRLAAHPGTKAYGALTVGVQAVARVERLLVVRPGSFRPPPRVASALVRFIPRTDPLVTPAEEPRFRVFVTACFSRRRKQMRNALAHALGRPAAEAEALLERLGIAPSVRPEVLAPHDFARILRADGQL